MVNIVENKNGKLNAEKDKLILTTNIKREEQKNNKKHKMGNKQVEKSKVGWIFCIERKYVKKNNKEICNNEKTNDSF